jgi:hypothetical protein
VMFGHGWDSSGLGRTAGGSGGLGSRHGRPWRRTALGRQGGRCGSALQVFHQVQRLGPGHHHLAAAGSRAAARPPPRPGRPCP